MSLEELFDLGKEKIIIINSTEYRVRYEDVKLSYKGDVDYWITYMDIEDSINPIREELEDGASIYHRSGWVNIVWLFKHLKK
jgi:hypothetical protein